MADPLLYLLSTENGVWMAQCVNYAIASEGNSPADAVSKLREALALAGIVGDLVDIAAVDEGEIEAMACEGRLLPWVKGVNTAGKAIDLGRLEDQAMVPPGAMSDDDYRRYVADGFLGGIGAFGASLVNFARGRLTKPGGKSS